VIPYRAFVDPSGGRHDSFTLGITHKEKDTVVIDLVRAWGTVVCGRQGIRDRKGYGIASVTGDNYAGSGRLSRFG
jgi:hypothetical protein